MVFRLMAYFHFHFYFNLADVIDFLRMTCVL